MGNALAGASVGWLALGVLLHLANQAVRGRGWFAIVRGASPGDDGLRRRDAILAWVAGAGAGGVVSARGGDVVRVLLLGRRAQDTRSSVLAGTLVAEAAGDALVGAAVIGLAVALGAAPRFGLPGPATLAAAGGALALLAVVALVAAPPRRPHEPDRRRRRPRLRPARAPRDVRPPRAAVAGRLARAARGRHRLLPARLLAARRRRRRAARDARPERRAPAAARPRLGRRLGRDARRRLRARHRHRRPRRRRRRVHDRHEPAAHARRRRARVAVICAGAGPRRDLARRCAPAAAPRRPPPSATRAEVHRRRGCGSPHTRTGAYSVEAPRGRP